MPPTRRRGADLERALHQAILDETAAVGYDAATVEGFAARAGTSKPVLYRRWPTKFEMVLAAIADKIGWTTLAASLVKLYGSM